MLSKGGGGVMLSDGSNLFREGSLPQIHSRNISGVQLQKIGSLNERSMNSGGSSLVKRA